MTLNDALISEHERLTMVYDLHEKGMSVVDIANKLEVSPIAVKKIIKRNDYKFKKDGKFKDYIIEACADFDIPKSFAIRLYNTLRRHGVVIVANGKEMVLVHELTDKQLLNLGGIGPKSVKIIRHAYEI